MSIRVLIVDDHAVVRAGLKLLVDAEDDLEAVGEAGSAREAVFEARTTKPDVVLMDVMMPEQSGLTVVPQLVKEHPEATVLVLWMQDDPRYVREAFEAGASGYVLKEAADGLVAAIRDVAAAGDTCIRAWGAAGRQETAERRHAEEAALGREREVRACWRSGARTRRSRRAVHLGRTETPCPHHAEAAALRRAELVRYALSGRPAHRPENGRRAALRRPVVATEESVYACAAVRPVAGSGLRRKVGAVAGFRRAPPMARIPKPMPLSSSAIPTTTPKSESRSAM